jgi:hypothetical protein
VVVDEDDGWQCRPTDQPNSRLYWGTLFLTFIKFSLYERQRFNIASRNIDWLCPSLSAQGENIAVLD